MVRIITNDNIKDAVNLWCYNKDEAIKIYGNIIGLWDVSRVTDMSNLFEDKSEFNEIKFNDDISNWDVSNVTDMSGMFFKAKLFNQPLNSWNVSNVTNMSNMFSFTESFNQPLNSWNVSNVTNMKGMFYGAISFNQDISSWKLVLRIEKILLNVSSELKEFELDKECHICQNTETNNNIVKVNCCNNNYHKDCLIKWLNINKTCPTCRTEF